MLDKFKYLATKLQWLKPILALIMLCSLCMVGYVLIGKSGVAENDYYLIPSILTTLWSFSIYWWLYTFPNVPDKADKSLGFFKRFAIGCKRFSYYVISFFAFGISLVIIFFTLRALRVWSGEF